MESDESSSYASGILCTSGSMSKDEIKKIKTKLSSKNNKSLFSQKINLIGPLNTIEEAEEIISSSKTSEKA